MSNWLRKLMPRQERFFPMFSAHALKIVDAATRLQAVMRSQDRSGDGGVGTLADEGQRIADDILAAMRAAFVTPFDRLDIKPMTMSMQAVLTRMRTLAQSKLPQGGVDFEPFGRLIVECAGELRRGVDKLDQVDQHADELKQMRDAIRGMHDSMVSMREDAIFRLLQDGDVEPMTVLAGIRLLDQVCGVVDRLDHAADCIDNLVLAHV